MALGGYAGGEHKGRADGGRGKGRVAHVDPLEGAND